MSSLIQTAMNPARTTRDLLTALRAAVECYIVSVQRSAHAVASHGCSARRR